MVEHGLRDALRTRVRSARQTDSLVVFRHLIGGVRPVEWDDFFVLLEEALDDQAPLAEDKLAIFYEHDAAMPVPPDRP